MIQNLCTVLVTTLAVCLTGCQETDKKTAPAASNEQAIPDASVQEVSNDVVAEELPFIIDDLEEITANDADQELTIEPAAEGSLQ